MITVSICCLTYNHHKYIKECLEGFLSQKTNFEIEILIHDDASTDSTQEIIKEYENRFPKIIKPIYQKENQYSKGVSLSLTYNFPRAKGKYIALCERDDYWTDPLKLQKQVDFLETNPDYVIHSGVAKILKEECRTINEENTSLHDVGESFEVEDFYGRNNLTTCTVLFKNCITDFPKEFSHVIFGDWFLYAVLLHETKLKAYRSVDIFSTYRVHNKSIMRSLSLIKYFDQNINQILKLKQYIGFKNSHPSVAHWINNYSIPKFRYQLSHKKYIEAILTFMLNIYYCKFKISLKRYLSVLKHNIWV